ncbi:hypothetical protein [Pseudoxanthomonas sp. UTMC 1351]|uniref:hypothetical protein n=1 Tax=Pseudoxanthomonas sp. UTMC 1351 TaxID=2695853 RepID=UPI0034CF678A
MKKLLNFDPCTAARRQGPASSGKALLARISRIGKGRHVKIVNGRSADFALRFYTRRAQNITRVTAVSIKQGLAAVKFPGVS